jgi:Protein of unknown function (DUF4435)
MLKWPTRAKAAIRSLFRPLQDIEVYIEDENDEVFYRTLLKRVADPEIKIARVISLGNRNAVVATALAHDHSIKPALFIVDGDLEWVRDQPKPIEKGLHRHNAYCVENLLICPHAITNLVAQDVVLSEEDAVRAVQFPDWVKRIDQPLTDLFAAYATAQELYPQLKTVSTGVGVMCTQRKKGIASTLDESKVRHHIAEILAEVETVAGKTKVRSCFLAAKTRIRALPFPLDAVSGKDFLLPLLNIHLHSLGSTIPRRSLRVRLAGMCLDSRLLDLKASVGMAANGWS